MSDEVNNVTEFPNMGVAEIPATDATELSLFEDRSSVFLDNVKKANLLSPELTAKLTELAPELGHSFRTQTIDCGRNM